MMCGTLHTTEIRWVSSEGQGDWMHSTVAPRAVFGGNFLAGLLGLDSWMLMVPGDDLFLFILPSGSTNAKLSVQRYFYPSKMS